MATRNGAPTEQLAGKEMVADQLLSGLMGLAQELTARRVLGFLAALWPPCSGLSKHCGDPTHSNLWGPQLPGEHQPGPPAPATGAKL
jgi:hypothetical protein